MIDKMNRDREAEMAQKVVKICKHALTFIMRTDVLRVKGKMILVNIFHCNDPSS